ncbi:ubiquitin family protein [Desulfopila aestuarii]|uniref:Mut7-C ubiquitin n=1 Tax=Desulfopila aestuarii DSM 18488 TaxID=1121416 RepID=A0A1M7YEP3_9BACT|nr:hypothetical protein [Desulfopila aestuarii]SHO51114.1 Mut7-C ubiquitin [Desulfopila aestuarii DSM 18488]
MEVLVKLLGILPSYYPQEYPEAGIRLELPGTATVADAVKALGIPVERVAIVTINDTLASTSDQIPENGTIKLMHRLVGG